MTAPRLAGSLDWMLKGMSPEDGFPILKAMGFDAVEHCFPYSRTPQEMSDLLKRNGLDISLIYTPCDFAGGDWGFASTPGREEEFAKSFAIALDYAQRVGCGVIGTLSGTIPEGADRTPYKEVLIANLAKAAKVARKAGVVISLEPIASERSPLFALNTMKQGGCVVRAVGDEALGLCFDTLHVALEKGSVTRTAREYRDLINYLQLGNPPDRLGPGHGDLDIPYILREILPDTKAIWLGCEYVVAESERRTEAINWAKPFIDAGLLRR